MARARLTWLLLSLWAVGCSRSQFTDGLPSSTDCTACHGQGTDPTPPPAVDGTTSTTAIAVGAHQIHMLGSDIAGPVECGECHILPMAADGTEHPDPLGRPATVDFGNLARWDSAGPVWDRETRTCAGTFCHGSTLRGGEDRPPPVWTRVDGSQTKCDSCHGNPPGESHPQDSQCEKCHDDVLPGGIIKTPELHVNGKVELIP